MDRVASAFLGADPLLSATELGLSSLKPANASETAPPLDVSGRVWELPQVSSVI